MQNSKFKKYLVLIFFILLFRPNFINPNEHETNVKSVAIELHVRGTTLHSSIYQRIMESIRSVSEKIILGKCEDELKRIKDSLEEALKKVFAQTLLGFSIQDLNIKVGEVTVITLKVIADDNLVRKVRLHYSIPYDKLWQDRLEDKLQDITKEINPILIGIPVESSEWTRYIVRPIIEKIIAKSNLFPGFDFDVSIQFAQETQVILKMLPSGICIKTVDVKITSSTLPNLLLIIIRYNTISYLQTLLRLPLKFIDENQEYVKKDLENIIKNRYKEYSLETLLNFKMSENFLVNINIESKKYYWTVQGILDMGIKEARSEGRTTIGKFIGKKDSIFLRFRFFPEPLSLKSEVGIGRQFSPFTFASIIRNLNDRKDYLWIVTSRENLYFEYLQCTDNISNYELGIGYKLRKFFIIKGVISGKDGETWLRGLFSF